MYTQEHVGDLVDRLSHPELQDKLQPGFQQGFSSSIIAQWEKSKYLTDRQVEVLEQLVERLESGKISPASTPSTFSKRRYEGYGSK